MRKILFSLAFTLATVVSAGVAAAAYVTADLNMRRGPSPGYVRIAVIPAGHQVGILNCGSGWCRVTYRGAVGWVSGRYLADGGGYYRPAPPPPDYYGRRAYPYPRHHYPHRWWHPQPWRPY
ncbi:SH3 domain-containing protein [Microbaculum sp. FT89]|uniref:SH3 domain-containing protein n=1 Tax=Microbaculum sp. FT89 TaxID=3447298 RepID=UPI003F52F89C